jgi:hypothetical protein
MAKPLRPPKPFGAAALQRRHRARVLASLIDVCRHLAGLKVSPEARVACRDVAELLETARARETGGARPARK